MRDGMWGGQVGDGGGVLRTGHVGFLVGVLAVHAVLSGAAGLSAQVGGGGAEDKAVAALVTPYRLGADGRFEFEVLATPEAVRIDGVLDDVAWLGATSIELPYEASPGNNTPAPVATVCMVSYDDRNLYLACEAQDPRPEAIRAYITDRDDIDGHDRLTFTLDPFNDARRAFEFGVSALGVQSDAVFAQGTQSGDGVSGSDRSWDAIWSSAGRITDTGYVVEAAVPFKSLRFPNADDVQTWGFYVRRDWPRSELVQTRSMRWDRSNSCVLCQANLLTGFQDISPGRNVELTPTFTSGRTDTREDFPDGPIVNGSLTRDVGVDLVWGITTDLTLNATVNPDFSQVEADVAQLDVNNRFALFFPEKRPFFLEGADFFQTPIRAVFTRTIADPTYGTKLSGKKGSNAAGLTVARDAVNNLIFPGDLESSGTSLDQSVVSAVGRFRRDVGSSSTVGALYTGREGSEYYNRVAGVDAFVRLMPALTAQGQYLHSESRYPDAVARDNGQPEDAFGGDGVTLQLRYQTRNWLAQWDASSFGKGFRADAGFLPQVNLRGTNAWVDRHFWADEGSWFTRITLSSGFWHNENLDGRLIGEGIWGNLTYVGPLQTNFWINPNVRRQFFGTEAHDLTELWFGISMTPSGNFAFGISGNTGGTIDFTNAREAHELRLSPSISLRAGRRVDLKLSHTYQRLTNNGVDVVRANLSQLRAVYNFNPRTFARVIVQYRDTDRNPDQFQASTDRSRSALFTQVLFSYKLNPQSVLFLGYSDNRNAFTDFQFREVGLTQSDRSLFLKLGYAIRP